MDVYAGRAAFTGKSFCLFVRNPETAHKLICQSCCDPLNIFAVLWISLFHEDGEVEKIAVLPTSETLPDTAFHIRGE